MANRHDIEFETDDALTLRGWLYLPEGRGRAPAITMAHGYGATRHHGIEPFARAFCKAGFVVLLHDHRNFGDSDVRGAADVDPWTQISDWRRAISFLESRPEVDRRRLGLWGTNYSGGHALVLGATDRRIGAVVAQVPTISGYQQGQRRVAPEDTAMLEQAFVADERLRYAHGAAAKLAIVSEDPLVTAVYRTSEAASFYSQPVPEGSWNNEVTVKSTLATRLYEPGLWAERVSPTPLMMIVAMFDTVTLTELGLDAYERALQPKALTPLQGGHFAAYGSEFDVASTAAVDWFKDHLGDHEGGTYREWR